MSIWACKICDTLIPVDNAIQNAGLCTSCIILEKEPKLPESFLERLEECELVPAAMSNDQLNQGIEELTGGCWCIEPETLDEEFEQLETEDDFDAWQPACPKCGSVIEYTVGHNDMFDYVRKSPNPDYCSDRNLCAYVIEYLSFEEETKFIIILLDILRVWYGKDCPQLTTDAPIMFLTAEPHLVAEAIYETLKETK